MIALDCYLTRADSLGPLAAARGDIVAHMFADLMETGNFRDRGDAIRQLHNSGGFYSTLDVLVLVDDAIYRCKQEAIAREMMDV